MRNFIKNLLAVLVAVAIVTSLPGSADAAVRRVEAPSRAVVKRYIVFVMRHPGYYTVKLNNGSVWHATSCRTEDSRNCFWNARLQGNHKGRSFIDINGHAIYRVQF